MDTHAEREARGVEWAPDLDLNKLRSGAELAGITVARHPDRIGHRLTLIWIQIELGRWDEAAVSLREAIASFPDSAELHRLRGRLLSKQNALEEALLEADTALALMPGQRNSSILRFDLLVRLRRWADVREMIPEIARIDPRNHALTFARISLLPATGRAGATLDLCDETLAECPGHTSATFFKATALAELGRADEARALIPLDRIVDVRDLPAPPVWRDRDTFREAIKEELARNKTVLRTERGKAHHNSERIVCLRQAGAAATEALFGLIREAVEDYESRMAATDTDHYRARPATARLETWATNYRTGGYEESHHHPSGWVSGVYYVAAARLPGEDRWRGPLIIGALNRSTFDSEPPWGTRAIEPVPGRLVLFPSYTPHATEHSGIEGERISVAFDVVPVH